MNPFCQTPKLKPVKTQCASCPFRHGNNAEFGTIVKKVCESSRVKFTKKKIANARMSIRIECNDRIDFACHNTVYESDMSLKDRSEHRQCVGATDFYMQGKG